MPTHPTDSRAPDPEHANEHTRNSDRTGAIALAFIVIAITITATSLLLPPNASRRGAARARITALNDSARARGLPPHPGHDHDPRPRNGATAPPAAKALPQPSQHVLSLAYRDGLIFDPEVQDTLARYARATNRDSADRALDRWLEAWLTRNPERAARARAYARTQRRFDPNAIDITTGTVRQTHRPAPPTRR